MVPSRSPFYFLLLALLLAACGSGSGGEERAEAPAVRGVLLRWGVAGDVRGFVIHWGMQSHAYTDAIDVGMPPIAADGSTSFLLDVIETPGTYVFAVTAYDDAGAESSYSNEMVAIVP